VLSNILTNFRAYATVLAGYTAGIVAADSINSPNDVFTIALARGAAIIVAIACSIVVTAIFAPHRAEPFTRKKLAELLAEAAHRAVLPWQTPIEDKIKVGKKLIDDAIAMDTFIEFAAAESGIFRLQANNARSLVAHVLGLISARRALDAHLKRRGWPQDEGLQIFHGVVVDLLNDVPKNLERHRLDQQIETIDEVRRQLAALNPERDTADGSAAVSARLVIDRIDDLLEDLCHALANWRDILDERWERMPTRTLNFHRDVRAAWINGLRAFIAVSLTGAFWIASAWSYGPNALIFVSVVISLFASFPRPDTVSWVFLLGSLPGMFLGPPLKYLVFAAGSGFDYLLITSFIFVIPMGLFLANPKTNFVTTAFMFVYLNLAGPANPMVYNLTDTINSAIAIILGTFTGVLAFVLILPPDPHAARAYVTYRVRLGLQLLAARVPIPEYSQWETRMYDRINRLHDPENPSGTHTDEWLNAGLSALTLGNEILRVRHLIVEEAMPEGVRSAAQSAIDGLAHLLKEPEPAYAALSEARARNAPLDPGPGSPQRLGWTRVTAALEEMDVYLVEHPRLLNRAPIP
jgi:uncharacterized membrane protein YccC